MKIYDEQSAFQFIPEVLSGGQGSMTSKTLLGAQGYSHVRAGEILMLLGDIFRLYNVKYEMLNIVICGGISMEH